MREYIRAEEVRFFSLPFVIFPFNASRKMGALPCFVLPYVGNSSKKVPEDSSYKAFSMFPFLYKARSFHRGGLQESCPEFEIFSGENELIDARAGQISRVHKRLIISSSANNSTDSSRDAAAIFSFEDFIGNFNGRPSGYVRASCNGEIIEFRCFSLSSFFNIESESYC